jgi:hypothetical protein
MIRSTRFAAIPEWVLTHPAVQKTPNLLMTYAALYLEGNYKDRTCEFSCARICERTGFKKTKVYADIKTLTEAGIVVQMPEGTLWLPLDDSVTAENVSVTAESYSVTAEKSELLPITNTELFRENRESDARVVELLEQLQDHVIANGFKPFTMGQQSYAAMRRLLERDGHTPEQVSAVIEWSQSDEFWLGNIRSPQKLREKFDALVGQMMRGKRGMLKFLNEEEYPW